MSYPCCRSGGHASAAHVDVIEAAICVVVACARQDRLWAEHWRRTVAGITHDAEIGVRRGEIVPRTLARVIERAMRAAEASR